MYPSSSDPVPTDLLTARQAAPIVHRHYSAIYRWVLTGRLRAWRLVRTLYVSEAELRSLYEPVQPAKPIPGFETKRQRRAREEHTRRVLTEAGILK